MLRYVKANVLPTMRVSLAIRYQLNHGYGTFTMTALGDPTMHPTQPEAQLSTSSHLRPTEGMRRWDEQVRGLGLGGRMPTFAGAFSVLSLPNMQYFQKYTREIAGPCEVERDP